MIVNKFTKRMRCSVQSCKVHASYGLGIKGIDYPMCEKHFVQLIQEGMELLDIKPKKEEKAKVEKPVEEVKEVKEEVTEVKVEAQVDGFFECKYCHEKFSKKEMTGAQFAQHSKSCKKAHE